MAGPSQPVPLIPDQPGISKRVSPLSVGNRWTDCDKVIFVDGQAEKFPGWTKKTLATVTDPIRGVAFWATQHLDQFIGMGTYKKLYVVDQSDLPTDITPVESTGTLTNPFTVTLGSSTVLVEHASHGRNVGDEVRFSDAALIPFTGMTIDGPYNVASIFDEDHYYIEHSVAALQDGTGGGTVTYEYEIPIGGIDPAEGDGFGAGGYGLGDYGAPTEDIGGGSIIFDPRVWNIAPYGDLLLANPVNGGIYKFDPADTPAYQRAKPLTNAPTVCRFLFVTPERFVFACGVDNDPLKIKWPDQDDPTNWTPGSTTTANERRLQEGTRIIGGAGVANLLSGVWTDTALYQFQYTGSSFIYDSKLAGKNCGLVSPMALVVHLSVAYWMSRNGFYYWSGGTPQAIPNSPDVQEFVLRAMRRSGYEFKCNAFFSPRYNLIAWFYVPEGSTEPGLYVLVSLTDFSWVVGSLTRTSGTLGPDERPLLAGADGYLYQHEDGNDADGSIMQAYLTRSPLRIAEGATLGEVHGFFNDMERQTGTMSIEVKTFERMNEQLDVERVFFEPGEDVVDMRVSGRFAMPTIRSEVLGGDFRLGMPMLDVKPLATRRR